MHSLACAALCFAAAALASAALAAAALAAAALAAAVALWQAAVALLQQQSPALPLRLSDTPKKL